MAARAPRLWLLLPCFVGCAGSDSMSNAPGPRVSEYGGQTGALLPPLDPDSCGPRLGPDAVLTISADSGFVALGAALDFDAGTFAVGDAGTARAGVWELASESGEAVALSAEANGETTVLRPAGTLSPGGYTLSYSCAGVAETATVRVVDVAEPRNDAPLVDAVNLVYEPNEHSCASIDDRVTLELRLSAARAQLADTTQLSLRGGGIDLVIAPYASIDASLEVVEIGVPICAGAVEPNCLPAEWLELSLVSEVLNEPARTAALPLAFDAACAPESSDAGGAEMDGAAPEACAVRARGRQPAVAQLSHARSYAPWFALGLLAASLGRRGRRRP